VQSSVSKRFHSFFDDLTKTLYIPCKTLPWQEEFSSFGPFEASMGSLLLPSHLTDAPKGSLGAVKDATERAAQVSFCMLFIWFSEVCANDAKL
jgi:hypothetical protein